MGAAEIAHSTTLGVTEVTLSVAINVEKYVFIYCLSDPITKEIRYVGKACSPKKRFNRHLHDLEINHKASWIKSLKRNNLIPDLDVIDTVPENEWKFWEQYWISQMKSWGFNLTNMTNGGDGGNTNKESIEKGRAKRLGKPAWNRGLKGIYDENVIQNLRNLNTGKKQSEETKRKRAETMKARWMSETNKPRTTKGKAAWNKGKAGVSEETRNRMKESAKLRPPISQETRNKIRIKLKARHKRNKSNTKKCQTN